MLRAVQADFREQPAHPATTSESKQIEFFTLRAGDWEQLATAPSVGARRLIRLERPVTAQGVRLRITEAPASPAIAEFGLFE